MKSLTPDICALLLVQLVACAYAAGRGGSASRLGAVMIAALAIGQIVAITVGAARWGDSGLLLAADSLLLAGLASLLLFTRHYWPIWAAAFQLTGLSLYFFPADLTTGPDLTLPAAKIFWTILVSLSLAVGAHEYRQPDRAEHGASDEIS